MSWEKVCVYASYFTLGVALVFTVLIAVVIYGGPR